MINTDITRQQTINSLMNFITEQVFITKNKRSLSFNQWPTTIRAAKEDLFKTVVKKVLIKFISTTTLN